MSDFDSHSHEIERGSERGFGIVFATIFLLIALYPTLDSSYPNWWFLIVSSLTLLVALLVPNLLYWPNKAWFRFGILLGSVVAPLVMFLVYVSTVVPVGLLLKIFGKDPMRRKMDASESSYWEPRETEFGSMKDQF